MKTDVLSVSSKGQIVLPIAMRRALNINTGDHLAVYSTDDAIVLKRLDMPTTVEFDAWLDAVRPLMSATEKVFEEHEHA